MHTVSAIIPCYNDSARACALVDALCEQRLPEGDSLQIVVVDDGSDPGQAKALREAIGSRTSLVALPANAGRAAARAAGVEASRGDVLVFIDADCMPLTKEWLNDHLVALRAGAGISIGPIEGIGAGFWHEYQMRASRERAARFSSGNSSAGTSANIAIRRVTYLDIGGFDPAFQHYGFEDVDLLIRASQKTTVRWVEEAPVAHLDRIQLANVIAKAQAAGQFSAAVFRRKHPREYAKLAYAKIDATRRPWLRPLVALRPAVAALARTFDAVEARIDVPMWLGCWIVRLTYAAAFAIGTAHSSELESSR